MRLSYDVVLFDVDDTLLDFYRAETWALEATLDEFGGTRPVADYIERFRAINETVWAKYERGEATSREIRLERFVLLLAELGMDADAELVSARYVEHLGESAFTVDGARPLVSALSGLVPMGLVTNGIGAVQRSRLAKSGLGDYFQAIVISDEVGIQKPDPGIFAVAREAVGATPTDRIIMVGDGLGSDIAGANAAGIHSCWVNLRGRPGNPEILPTYTVSSLSEVYPILGLPPGA